MRAVITASCSGVNDIGNVDLAVTTPNDWPAMFPFWTDLTFQAPGAGSVFYQTVGAKGNQRFIVQWNKVSTRSSSITTPDNMTFQVILNQDTSTVEIRYGAMNTTATTPAFTATIGVEDLIVIAADNAVLICKRGDSQDVKEIVDYLRRKQMNDFL